MPYELGYFHDLVDNEILTPEARMKLWMKAEYKQQLENIRIQTKGVKTRMVHYKVECTDGKIAEKYVKDHQDALVVLADRGTVSAVRRILNEMLKQLDSI